MIKIIGLVPGKKKTSVMDARGLILGKEEENRMTRGEGDWGQDESVEMLLLCL